MAKTVALATLIADVRALYEIRSITLDDTLLTRWINQSYAYLYDRIISVAPDTFRTSDTINLVSGTATYVLTSEMSDFYKGVGLDVLLSSGKWWPLEFFPWEERNLYQSQSVDRSRVRYAYVGLNLHLAPAPTWTQTGGLNVWYIPTPTVLVGGGTPNTIDTFNSWDEFIVYDVAMKCAIKEESSAAADLRASRKELLNDIMSAAKQRDFSHAAKIRDVRTAATVLANPFSRLPRP